MSRPAKLDLAAIKWIEDYANQGHPVQEALRVYGVSPNTWMRARDRLGLGSFNPRCFIGKRPQPALQALYEEMQPGCCAVCGQKLPVSLGRPRKICKERDCLRAYQTLYAAGRRQHARILALARRNRSPRPAARMDLVG